MNEINVRELHPAAGDAVAATEVLRDAVARCDRALAPDASLHLVAEVLEHVLGSPRNLRSAGWIIARTAEPGEALRYEAAIAEVGQALEDKTELLSLRLLRALARSGEAEAMPASLRLLAARARRLGRHLPDETTQRWLSLVHRAGIEASVAAQNALLWERPFGAVRAGGHELAVSHQNARALMQDPDARVRREVAEVVARYAVRRAAVFEPLKRGRVTCARDAARGLGHRDAYERFLLDNAVTEGAIEALRAQREPILELTGRYYEWKRRRLGLDVLREVDLGVRGSGHAVDLSFDRLVACARSCAGTVDNDYPAIVDALLDRGCVLSSPDATRSPEWVCVTNLAGGLPFVHAPYRADYESFVAAAHELGHACQFTASARRVGALALYAAPAWFAETFSLRAEIDVVHASLDRAQSAQERAFWAEAAIDQWLHFVRTLQIAGSFDRVLQTAADKSRQELSEARDRIRRELSPGFLQGSVDGEDASWLLQTHSDHDPCMGLQYGLAMMMAYRSRLDGRPLRELSDHGANLAIEEACSRYLGIDVADEGSFTPIWRHVDELFAILLEAAP